MGTTETVDVCIIGAGLAGLRAAQRLSEQGLSVRVLEARERVGGRTAGGLLCGEAIDLGGQWLGSGQTRALALCKELGLNLYEQHSIGKRILSIDNKSRSYQGKAPPIPLLGLLDSSQIIWRLNRAAKTIDPAAPWTSNNAVYWDRMTVAEWLQRNLHTKSAHSLMKIIMRALHTSEPHEVSMLCLLASIASAGDLETQLEARGNGAQRYKISGGAFQLAELLAKKLPNESLLLNAPVLAVKQSETHVTITHAKGEVCASKVIVALAPVLATRINFEPALPSARLQLQSRMPMGSVIKVLVAYERPFWREQGLTGEAISDTEAFSPVADATPHGSKNGFLVGFFAGKFGQAMAGMDKQTRREIAVQSLQHYFGPQAAHPIDYIDQNWISESWSLGGYTSITSPGTLTSCGYTLRTPCGRIHWSGSETATEWTGYIDGAISSGERVAEEILAAR